MKERMENFSAKNLDTVKKADEKTMDFGTKNLDTADKAGENTIDFSAKNLDTTNKADKNTINFDVENCSKKEQDTKKQNIQDRDIKNQPTRSHHAQSTPEDGIGECFRGRSECSVQPTPIDGISLLKKLGSLPPSIITEAAQDTGIRRFQKRRHFKLAAAAALLAVCLMAGGGIVVASVLGIQIFDIQSDKDTSSYDMRFVTRYRPQDAFGGHIDEVKKTIRKQCEEYKPEYSSISNAWYKDFEDWESALAYLAVDFIDVPITSRQPTNVKLAVLGTREGSLQSVSFYGVYESERYNLYVSLDIYVDDSEEEVAVQRFSATGGEADYHSETYVTANGTYCMLVDTIVLEQDGSTHAEGYMVKDGIMYCVSAIPQQRNGETGEARMEIVKELLEEISGK